MNTIRTGSLPGPWKLIVLVLFLFSGLTGLVYEVVWVKILSLIFGSTNYSVSTILASFFFGIGLGGYLAGRFADRLRRPFATYCVLELVIALYALAVPLIFDGVGALYIGMQRQLGHGSSLAGCVRVLAAFMVLVIPTLCMGATLPILARVVVDRVDRVGKSLGGLYAINTWGAVLGCFLAGFVFLPGLGVSVTLRIAAAINFLIGIIGLAIAGRVDSGARTALPGPSPVEAAPETVDVSESSSGLRALLWISVFASGFSVLALEVIWTRILVFFLRYTVYAFSTMLTAFLMGLALGAFLSSRLVDRRRRIVAWLGGLQVLIGVVAVLSLRVAGFLEAANRYLLTHLQPEDEPNSFVRNMSAKFILCFMVMFVPSLVMGMVFPSLLKIWVARLGRVARQTGRVYFVNTVGAMLGALAAGFVMIPTLGLIGSVCAVAAVNMLIGLALLVRDTSGGTRAGVVLVSIVAVVGTFVIVPPTTASVEVLNLVPQHREGIKLVEIREGNSATVTVLEKSFNVGGRLVKSMSLGINGVIVATGSQFTRTDRLNAYIPLLVHPDPKDVLVMGAAAGLTLDACVQFPVERVDGVEIVPSVVELMPLFSEYNHDVIHDSRVEIILDDARNFLEITDRRYDVIINEAWLSVVTGSTPLYSREFFALVKSRLKPGGILSLGPGKMDRYVEMTNSTVLAEFPHGYIWYIPEIDTIMSIATLEPLSFSGLRDRWRSPGVADVMAGVNIFNPDQFLSCLVLGPEGTQELTGQGTVCTDNKPVYEYLQSSVYFLDTERQQPEDHVDEKFNRLIERQTGIEHLFAESGDPPELIRRRIDAMQFILRARQAARAGDTEKAGQLFQRGRALLP